MRQLPIRWVAALIVAAVLALVAGSSPASAVGGVDPNSDIHQYGSAGHFGDTAGLAPASPVVDMAATPSGNGYWLVSADGGVYAFGDAGFFGSLGDVPLIAPIVGVAATPSGNGYWLVSEDGGIFAFGDAGYFGSMGAVQLNQPIVAMAAHPSGNGYWMAAGDGGIFAFGASGFFGSMGAVQLNQPVVGMAAHPSGNGYWLVALDGGIFAFGVGFFGSTGDIDLNEPVLGMAAHPSGDGYWMVARDGGIFAFGSAGFHGSAADIVRSEEVTAIAAHPDGDGYWMARAAGPVWPLTGTTTAAVVDRPALAVKIDNHSLARGQWGINQADVVVEELVEGNISRFIGIFHSQAPAVVGPIRSARETDVGLLPMLGEALLVYSGGNSTVRSIVDAAPAVTGIYPVAPYDSVYYRTSRRSAPHNLLSGAPGLWAVAPQTVASPIALFDYRDEVLVTARTPAIPGPMFVDFGGANATWTWNGAQFARAHGATTHRDADRVPVTADNVIVLETPYFTSGSTGSPVADAVGVGQGWLLSDGAQIFISWSRASTGSRYVLTEVASGNPVELAPGRTWLELIPTGLSPFNA